MLKNELLELAREAANAAVETIRDGASRPLVQIAEKSTPTDLVTEIDKRAEERIRNLILGRRPDDGFIGEESGRIEGSDITWIVDPIDGTTNFVYRNPAYAVSIAATDDEGALVGIVVDVAKGEYFEAVRGGGSYLNGARLLTTQPKQLSSSLIATGFSYDSSQRERQARALVSILPNIRDIRRAGAASLDLCSVAAGRVDGYFESGLWSWDFAAGALIAQEAGATVDFIDGTDGEDDIIVAAHPSIYHELRTLIEKATTPDFTTVNDTAQHSGTGERLPTSSGKVERNPVRRRR